MIKLGMLIGGRYEVLEKIGTGGMSDVYKAKDQKLNRFVAVKVLKQEFSENRNFVSKFRVEAQAAAGLMHPNIVNVYDVGEENGIHYIVMELVEGITLKKYIEKKVRLTTKEAISIAIQVAMGIEAAHNNHIIHRDIKPQNIMISKEGKVKEIRKEVFFEDANLTAYTEGDRAYIHFTMRPARQLIVALKSRKWWWNSGRGAWSTYLDRLDREWVAGISTQYAKYV